MRASIGLWMGLVFLSMCPVARSLAQSRPAVFEEKVKLTSPDPAYDLLQAVALDGNDLLTIGQVRQQNSPLDYYALFHFERQSDGTWISRGKIDGQDQDGAGVNYFDVALRGNVAVWAAEWRGVRILERTAAGWTVTRRLRDDFAIPGETASEVRIVGDTIALGARHDGDCKINLVRKNAQGVWSLAEQIVSNDAQCAEGDIDVLGPDVMEYTGSQALISHGLANIYDRVNNAWVATPLPQRTERPVVIGNEIALRAGFARDKGDILYLDRRNGSGQWAVRDTLRSEESYANVRPGNVAVRGNRAVSISAEPYVRDAVNVFDRDSSGRFTHVATLRSSDGWGFSNYTRSTLAVSADGRTIAVHGSADYLSRAVYVYELPATLPQSIRVQDNFQDANAAGWTPYGITNWSVQQSDGSYVYRQANTQGDARAILGSVTSQNQSIEADVKLNTFGPTSWAGLITRYTDVNNFYYLMIWNNKTIQIRKMVNGSYSTIATAPFTPAAGRTYRLRLEAVGTLLRAYVDGTQALHASDSSHSSGQPGLTMWKTNADYDNVIVSSSPATTLLSDTFEELPGEELTPWTTSAGSNWIYVDVDGPTEYRQTVLDVTARAINGAPARDQIVTAVIRPESFHASGTPFAGLIARYVDSGNYYYVLLNKNNTVSLRKLSNGAVQVLDEAPLTIQTGTRHRVRLEAIGNSLRLYVNGRLMAEAEDSSYPSGRYGLVTYRSIAQFDDFSAVRP